MVRLDGQQALSLQTEQMLLLQLLNLKELLLKRQLLCGNLPRERERARRDSETTDYTSFLHTHTAGTCLPLLINSEL